MTFRVGQEVVCIDNTVAIIAQNTFPNEWPEIPAVGSRYTIREVFFNSSDGAKGVRLKEIHCGIIDEGECGFIASSFRPIVKTDISIFEAMLTPAPKQRVQADA